MVGGFIGFGWFLAAAAIVLIMIEISRISGLRAKLRELMKERDALEKLSVKNLVQLEVKWRNDGGGEEEWKAVMTQSCCDSFLAEVEKHLTWKELRDEPWTLPRPFAWIKNGMLEAVCLYTLGNAQWNDAPEIIDFNYSRCLWHREKALVRSLAEDLAFMKGTPLTAQELVLFLNLDVPPDISDRLLEGMAIPRADQALLTNLRAALDEIARHWRYDQGTVLSRLGRLKSIHPTPLAFIRGILLGTGTPVLELLETEEGTKQVLAYIVAESDFPKEEPKAESSAKEPAAGC